MKIILTLPFLEHIFLLTYTSTDYWQREFDKWSEVCVDETDSFVCGKRNLLNHSSILISNEKKLLILQFNRDKVECGIRVNFSGIFWLRVSIIDLHSISCLIINNKLWILFLLRMQKVDMLCTYSFVRLNLIEIIIVDYQFLHFFQNIWYGTDYLIQINRCVCCHWMMVYIHLKIIYQKVNTDNMLYAAKSKGRKIN